jgi:hypothetical protein
MVGRRNSQGEKKNDPWSCDEKLIDPPDAVLMRAALQKTGWN